MNDLERFDPTGDERQAWIRDSNALAQPLLDYELRQQPEMLGSLGLAGVGARVSQLPVDKADRHLAAGHEFRLRLTEQLAEEAHLALRLDLELMIEAIDLEAEVRQLESEFAPACPDPARIIYQGVTSLLADPTGPQTANVATRLRRYAGMEDDHVPVDAAGRIRGACLLGAAKSAATTSSRGAASPAPGRSSDKVHGQRRDGGRSRGLQALARSSSRPAFGLPPVPEN